MREDVISCEACPRLREHCRAVAEKKRRAYMDQDYWGRPVPSFGPLDASLLVVGLAPGAHGANRTGRMFTGDRSGDALYAALHAAGFANQPTCVDRNDGLELLGARITNVVRCAPPQNKPKREEILACREHFLPELRSMPNLSVVVALGKIAYDGFWQALRELDVDLPKPKPPFAHGAEVAIPASRELPSLTLLASYHPSQQNMFTGVLTQEQLNALFLQARKVTGENL